MRYDANCALILAHRRLCAGKMMFSIVTTIKDIPDESNFFPSIGIKSLRFVPSYNLSVMGEYHNNLQNKPSRDDG